LTPVFRREVLSPSLGCLNYIQVDTGVVGEEEVSEVCRHFTRTATNHSHGKRLVNSLGPCQTKCDLLPRTTPARSRLFEVVWPCILQPACTMAHFLLIISSLTYSDSITLKLEIAFFYETLRSSNDFTWCRKPGILLFDLLRECGLY